jgi:hypothetical protein
VKRANAWMQRNVAKRQHHQEQPRITCEAWNTSRSVRLRGGPEVEDIMGTGPSSKMMHWTGSGG